MAHADKTPAPPPRFVHHDVNRLGLAAAVVKALAAATARALTSPFKGDNGANTYLKDVAIAGLRTQLGHMTLAHDRYLNSSSTTATYHKHCAAHSTAPASITLPSGTQAHWLGSSHAPKVLVYFHGGGYVMPCSDAHLLWLDSLRKTLTPELSVLLLAYDLAPESPYPTQLRQAVELLRHLVETERRSPADISLGGDSAGGNLTLGVLSHLAHPHPSIPALSLPTRLHAALLLSPWTSLTQHHTPAHARNAQRDLIDARSLSRWAAAFLASPSPFAGDPYSEPVLAGPDWWAPVAHVVDEVLIWGGANEVLIDGIEAFARKFCDGFRQQGGKVALVVTDGAMHVDMLVDFMLGYKGTGCQRVVEDWVKAKL